MKHFIKSAIACLAAVAMVVTAVPANVSAAPKKAVVVTSQKALERAIKKGATKITIKTNKNVEITIPSGKKMAKVNIVVNAKNATITNKSTAKSLTIKDALSFTEKGTNNTIKITDTKLTVKVANAAKGTEIAVAKKNADVTLVVSKKAEVAAVEVAAAGVSLALEAKGSVSEVKVAENATDAKLDIDAAGTVENVTVDAKADVEVKGSTTETIKVVVNAPDTVVKAETAVDTTLNADAKVDLSAGAEGSKVSTSENVKADVVNQTSEEVKVTDSKGTESTVDAGKTETKTDSKTEESKTDTSKDTGTSGGSSSGSSSSGGSTTPSGKTWTVSTAEELEAAIASAAAIDTIQIKAESELTIDKTVSTAAIVKIESKLIVSGNAVTFNCGDLYLNAGSVLTIEEDAKIDCKSFNITPSTAAIGGLGKVVSGTEVKYDGAELDALHKIVKAAGTYAYSSGKNYVTMGGLSISGTAVTLDYNATKDEFLKCAAEVYKSKKTTADAATKGAVAYCVDSVVMNTFNRYIAALYKADKNSAKAVKSISFGGITYQWIDGKSTNGSCWYTGDDGTSLVSAVVDAQDNRAIRDVSFDLVGTNGMKVTVTFKAENVPTETESLNEIKNTVLGESTNSNENQEQAGQ